MKVIIAGFSKTGTKTLNAALTELGYEVYDFLDHFWYHGKDWMRIFQDGGTVHDFKQMYKDVDAVCDVPAFTFWEEIHEAFPDSKIILTIREEESWLEKVIYQIQYGQRMPFVQKVIYTMLPTNYMLNKYVHLYYWVCYGISYGSIWKEFRPNKLLLKKKYREHNSYILQHAPKDKLLVFDLNKGWSPLCEFLGKKVPKTPFPWRNKNGGDIAEMIRKHPYTKHLIKEFILLCCVLVLIVSVLLYSF